MELSVIIWFLDLVLTSGLGEQMASGKVLFPQRSFVHAAITAGSIIQERPLYFSAGLLSLLKQVLFGTK
jgi:hypothetical protein